MTLLFRSLMINWIVSIVAGCIAVLYFVWFSGVSQRELPHLIWILGTMMFLGFVIQGFMHFIWLRHEDTLGYEQAWKLHPERQMRIFVRILRFPTWAASLAISLWVFLGALGSFLFWMLYPISSGTILMLLLITISCGGFATVLQIFLYRLFLLPRLETVMRTMPGISEQIIHIPVILPIRAKLLLLSLFLVFLIFAMIFSAGYGKGRMLIREQTEKEIRDLYLTLEQDYSKRSSHSEDFWDTLWVVVGGPARIVDYKGFEVVVNKKTASAEALDLLKKTRPDQLSPSRWIYLKVPGKEYILEALIPWSDFAGELRDYLEIFFISFFLGGLILSFISYSASREFSFSLKRLSLWCHHLSRGRLQEKPKIQDDDDLSMIIFSIDQIRKTMEDQIFSLDSAAGQLYSRIKKIRDQIEMLGNRSSREEEILRAFTRNLTQFQKMSEQQTRNLLTIGEELQRIIEEARGAERRLNIIESTWDHVKTRASELELEIRNCRDHLERLRTSYSSSSFVELSYLHEAFHEIEQVVEEVREKYQRLLLLLQQNPLLKHTLPHPGSSPTSESNPHLDFPSLYEEKFKKLEKLLNQVHEVAEDTHLSSLNAAIRSTKAKEIGRSFTVISDQVRDLADALQTLLQNIRQTLSHFSSLLTGNGGNSLSAQTSLSTEVQASLDEDLIQMQKRGNEQLKTLKESEQLFNELKRHLKKTREEFVLVLEQAQSFLKLLEQLYQIYDWYHHEFQKVEEYIFSLGIRVFPRDQQELKGLLINFEHLEGMRISIEKFAREYAAEQVEIIARIEKFHTWIQEEERKQVESLKKGIIQLEEIARMLAETFVRFKI